MVKTIYSKVYRISKIIAGFTVLLIGILLFVLPGPAVVVIPIGLGILATEFIWARKLLDKAKKTASTIVKSKKNKAESEV
ncbi:hypothetical protein MCHI_000771 [Candidatus Magnetoovum chiemensis]|nr:hypothetical protein MCHI_000771 [Candidatus Magnetoovum chiemensis]